VPVFTTATLATAAGHDGRSKEAPVLSIMPGTPLTRVEYQEHGTYGEGSDGTAMRV